MSPAIAADPSPQEKSSHMLHFRALVGLATAGALACTLPAMMRVSAGLAGAAPNVRAWGALGAGALGPMGVSLIALRGARQGLRVFDGASAQLRLFGLGLWLALLFVALSLFGGVLRATTHHHSLAGVTYACGALAFAVGWGVVCARLVATLRALSAGTRRVAMILVSAGALAAIVAVAFGFVRAVGQGESSAAAVTVVDVLAFAAAALFASLDWRAAWRPLAVVGPPVAVFLAALGITTLRDPPVREAIHEHAPAFAPMTDLLSWR